MQKADAVIVGFFVALVFASVIAIFVIPH